jgi:hypothetical protein
MGRLLMSPTNVRLKSTNWYKSAIVIEKKIPNVIKNIIECHYGQYTCIFNKIQLNHHWKNKIIKIVDTWQQYVIHSYYWPKKSHGSHKWQYTYGQSKDKIIFYWFFFFHPQSMSFATMVACNLTFVVDLNRVCCLQLKPMGTNCITKKKTNRILHVYKLI